MTKNNDNICKDCAYMVYDVMGEARCTHPGKEGHAPIISEYLPACFRFLKNR